MSWKQSLLEASFRGVIFDCISTDDEVPRSTAEHSYPYKHGGAFEDLANEPKAISIQAIFYGDNYESDLKKFIAALDVLGSGELVHPVFGSIQAQVFGSYKVSHTADDVDQAKVSLQFKEDSLDPKLFSQNLPIQKAEAVSQALNTARAASATLLVKEVTRISALKASFARVDALRTTMTSALSGLRNQVANVVTSGLDVVNYPLSFATDIGALVSGIVDLRGFNAGALMTDWRYVSQLLSTPVVLTSVSGQSTAQPVSDVLLISSTIALHQATAKADATQIVLSAEAQTATLSAPEIELMVNDARTDIEACIVAYRSLFSLENSRPVIEALKTTALSLQEAARSIIEARPPLITKVVDAPGNLRLIAHKWYGDHTRAPELFRLNRSLRMPNFIGLGDVLNAYAR